jgi:hypothetical protein
MLLIVLFRFVKFCNKEILIYFSQGRKTKFAFPLYTVETGTKFCSRFHCIQGKRKFRFSSLIFQIYPNIAVVKGVKAEIEIFRKFLILTAQATL